MLRWNGKTYRPYGPGVNYKRINPVVKDLMSPLDTDKVGLHLVAQFIIDADGPGTSPIPSATPSVTPTLTPSSTPSVTPTPTPSATPPEQFFILLESGDILQAENLDLLVLESAP